MAEQKPNQDLQNEEKNGNESNSENHCSELNSGCDTAGEVDTHSINTDGSSSKKKPINVKLRKKNRSKLKDMSISKKKKLPSWSLSKLNCSFRRIPSIDIAEPTVGCSSCVCTGYRRTEDHHLGAGIVFETTPPSSRSSSSSNVNSWKSDSKKPCSTSDTEPIIDLSKFNPEEYPIEDCDERARRERAREIEEGVDPPPGYQILQAGVADDQQVLQCASKLKRLSVVSFPSFPDQVVCQFEESLASFQPPNIVNDVTNTQLIGMNQSPSSFGNFVTHAIHTQIDYIHCLVPDLLNITKCSFYWGKMDQYEAERLLENKPEGTFLLRDSAQEDYLFSVSFRRYGRSLHARIEQWNHKFSFDAHDPGVFASSSVCGLIEHYKDPSRCMFFEPMLTIPLHRSFTFSLQHLCRSSITDKITYDSISRLPLPKSLKSFLKEYHYKQRVRVRLLDNDDSV